MAAEVALASVMVFSILLITLHFLSQKNTLLAHDQWIWNWTLGLADAVRIFLLVSHCMVLAVALFGHVSIVGSTINDRCDRPIGRYVFATDPLRRRQSHKAPQVNYILYLAAILFWVTNRKPRLSTGIWVLVWMWMSLVVLAWTRRYGVRPFLIAQGDSIRISSTASAGQNRFMVFTYRGGG